jgi:hypothetical protein
MVSPCVSVLRDLANRINTDLGASQGKRHSTPDLTKDIDTLMASLKQHGVYVYKEGRVLDDDEKPAADIISVGLATLTHGSGSTALDEFNTHFNQARERRRIRPVSELLHRLDQPTEVLTSSPSMIAVAPPTPPHTTITTSTNAADSGAPAQHPAGVEGTEMQSDSEEEEQDGSADEFGEDEPTLTRDDEEDVVFDMDTVLKVMAPPEYDWSERVSSEEDRDSEAEVTDNEPAGYSSV